MIATMKLLERFPAVLRARDGAAAVEFALAAPLMITLLFGSYEATQALMAYMKMTSAAQTMIDLVTQQQKVTNCDIDTYYSAGQLVMAPLSGGSLGVAVTNVKFNGGGTGSVEWHQERGGASPMSNAVSLASGYAGANESVVIAQTNYVYTSWLHYIMPTPLTLNQISYSRPRTVADIPLTTGVTCP